MNPKSNKHRCTHVHADVLNAQMLAFLLQCRTSHCYYHSDFSLHFSGSVGVGGFILSVAHLCKYFTFSACF